MSRSPELDFWLYVVEQTLKVARKLPAVTDSHIRSKMGNFRAQMKLERDRMEQLLEPDQLTVNAVRKLPYKNEIRRNYEARYSRFRKYFNLYQGYQTVLYARLFLKGGDSMAAYVVGLLAPDEKQYRVDQMQQEFPD